ncbi:MAG: ATP-binding protein [Salinibacterium sp.]|nr:ATP-binding protein [Salinibacterium sp.]
MPPNLESSLGHPSVGGLREIILRAAGPARAVVLIDGRSGSGKSGVARELAASWPEAQLVRLDDVYPGWEGLEQASRQVAERMLSAPDPAWQRWDWVLGVAAEWVPLDPARPLIVEGIGSLSRANRRLASYGIWIELDAVTRKRRALERDGEQYERHWHDWAVQEERFIAREHPQTLADLVIDERSQP